MPKKIMLLGGNFYQMTATKAAKKLGCHVISVDYLPDNLDTSMQMNIIMLVQLIKMLYWT